MLCYVLLQAQRLAAIDAMLRNGAGGGATSVGSGDLDSKLKRLAGDVRVLKERLAELAGAGLQTGQVSGVAMTVPSDEPSFELGPNSTASGGRQQMAIGTCSLLCQSHGSALVY